MKLIDYDKDSVTIKLDRKTEFARLLGIVMTASSEYESLDPELLMLSEEQVDKVAKDIFDLADAAKVVDRAL